MEDIYWTICYICSLKLIEEMEKIEEKILAFEYTIKGLAQWYTEIKTSTLSVSLDHLGKLKLFKLHFFVSAISTQNASPENDLLNLFDEFYALPYGPVESSIYDNLSKTQIYDIQNISVRMKTDENTSNFERLDGEIKSLIDRSISSLKKENIDLVTYDAFTLVDISHAWLIWRMMYAKATSKGKRSERIPVELIRGNRQIYRI